MTKQEVFNFLNSGIDKSGYLKKEMGFKKKFPELYDEFSKTQFPSEIENLPFKQKLWHFLKEDYCVPTCKICGNPVTFKNIFKGYHIYCSRKCSMNDEYVKDKVYSGSKNTCLEKYGVEHYNQTTEGKEKHKQTCLERYGVENYAQTNECKEKVKTTFLNHYGVEYYFQTDEFKNNYKKICVERYGTESPMQAEEIKKKITQTCLEKYGETSYSKTPEFIMKLENACLKKFGTKYYTQSNDYKEKKNEFMDKQIFSKKNNHTITASSIEEDFSNYLTNNKIQFIRQYKSNAYNFNCDFYLPNYDLYIEIQGTWTHGGHPFNENDKDDINKLTKWKNKNTNYYLNAIYTWTQLDVKKRLEAKKNNLNYLEIFSNDINECISQLKQKIESL